MGQRQIGQCVADAVERGEIDKAADSLQRVDALVPDIHFGYRRALRFGEKSVSVGVVYVNISQKCRVGEGGSVQRNTIRLTGGGYADGFAVRLFGPDRNGQQPQGQHPCRQQTGGTVRGVGGGPVGRSSKEVHVSAHILSRGPVMPGVLAYDEWKMAQISPAARAAAGRVFRDPAAAPYPAGRPHIVCLQCWGCGADAAPCAGTWDRSGPAWPETLSESGGPFPGRPERRITDS